MIKKPCNLVGSEHSLIITGEPDFPRHATFAKLKEHCYAPFLGYKKRH